MTGEPSQSGFVRPRSVFITTPDGLRLHALEWTQERPLGLPVLCLPGLTRNADDFLELGSALAGTGRRVIAVDYRGRGGSDWDPDPARYTVPVETADVLALCDSFSINRALVVGTSRGGLIAMAIAAARPALLAAVVLNDIGPVIEADGLRRIRGYAGRMPAPADWSEAGQLLASTSDGRFPRIGPKAWERYARLVWRTDGGKLSLRYDPELRRGLEAIDLDQPIPSLWDLFDALGDTPVLVIRGANSDLLSEATVAAMSDRRSAMETRVIADQGHAPFLDDAQTIAAISDFLARVETASAG
jgi:pimeloyl-ACP methyl ester carboxylesterase